MVRTNINKNHKGHVLNKLAKTVLNMETESLFTKAYFFKIKETITDIVKRGRKGGGGAEMDLC